MTQGGVTGFRVKGSVKASADERDSDLIPASGLTGWVKEPSGGREALAAA
jgi:hypothetical protein